MNPNWPVFLLSPDSAPPTGGGAPAPSPAPSSDGAPSSPIPDSPAEPTGSHDNFAGMEDNDFDLVEVPTEEIPTGGEPGEPGQTTPPTEKQPAAATAPPATPQQTAPPQGAPTQDAPSAPRSSLDQAIDGFRTNHNQLSAWASTELFALSKEDAEGLENDAAAMIPVLMGRVYSQALQATTNLIKNFVPQMVSEGVSVTNARTAKATEALQEFYAANPNLNAAQHGALVDKWARAFRAANPSASRADAIKFVGNAVSAELGVAPSGPNGARPHRAAPFAPARPGTRTQTPSAPHDPYEGMDMDYDQE